MGNILIVGSNNSESESIAESFWQETDDIAILIVNDEESTVIKTLEKKQVDLVIYDLSSLNPMKEGKFARITHRFPYIPSIALLGQDDHQKEKIIQAGAGYCFTHPVDPNELYQQARNLMEISTSGTVKGFPVHSLLQMFESEAKTCTLKIQGKEDNGLIFIDKGVVIAAETSDQENENAIYSMVTWEDAIVEIRYFNLQRQHLIKKPLISLIMESFRLKDERDSLSGRQESQKKPRLELKHISTAGNRIALEVGAKIKMEFDDINSPLISAMVGMIPDEYIIVATPTPFSIVETALINSNRIIVKYLHMGRLCMFRTYILKSITDPYRLLFLKYPSIIHYHELRRAKRTSIFIPCTIHLPGEVASSGVLVDLNRLGCLCELKAKVNRSLPNIDINTKIQLRCLLPGVMQDPELNGIVKNIRKSSSEIRIGVEFVELQGEIMKTIDRYLYSVRNIVQ